MTGVRAADTQPEPEPALLTCPRCDRLYPSDAVHVSRCSGIPVIQSRSYQVVTYRRTPLRHGCPSCDRHFRNERGIRAHMALAHGSAA